MREPQEPVPAAGDLGATDVRTLLPEPGDHVDLLDAYAIGDVGRDGRPFVRANMISSLDGAIAVHGRSGALGGPADRHVFQVLRSLTDVVLVGAGTARAERYGPARLDGDVQRAREGRGQPPVPPIAVVTRSCHLDWDAPLFTEAENRTLVITTSDCDPGSRQRGERVADVVAAGDQQVDLGAALVHLYERGHRSVLLEGGPRLNGQMVAAGLLDELCLTVAPRMVAGDGPRVLAGNELQEPLDLDIVHLLEEDGFLFYRLALPR
jgi:riboflavin-specific deaminase-like protein